MSAVAGADETVRAEILAVEAERHRALVDVDVAALDAILDDSLVHVHAPGLVHTKAQFLEHVETRRAFLRIERGELNIRVVDDVAVVVGPITNHMRTPDGGERTQEGVVTQVLVRSGRSGDVPGWRFISFQLTPYGEQIWGKLPSEQPEEKEQAR
ncbi:nuclear transport factor 2 family protein [Myceligenerans salitolerans]|uniref:Nuclear transport factor 2 family protein n=1 Tax=Myceligenerans salitolerans TaxID=1230528 RepID=A0ABS3IAZ3_9MICO|nr:nuclear transport factor 2 family protein [Myceligenerans salitolerans]MBO0610115.1 nuclear transport factor 2 family protein [Myceligenerans salitolerans]